MERGRSRARCSTAARSPSSRPRVRAGVESHLATLVRKELIRSTAPDVPRGRGFSFPPPPHPRRRLRVAAEGDAGGAARAVRRLALRATSSSRATRSSATTSSRRTGTGGARHADPMLPGLAAHASEHLAAAGRGALDRGDQNAGRALLRGGGDPSKADGRRIETGTGPRARALRVGGAGRGEDGRREVESAG